MEQGLVQKQNGALATGNAINNMFGNTGYQMPVDAAIPEIKIMRESAQFETPAGEYLKEFEGHILHWHNANQYWEKGFDERDEGDSPLPNCLSSDGIHPDDLDHDSYRKQCDNCRECPMNQYGSDTKGGDGKACQNTIRMYVLSDGEVVPCLLKAPPSSLGKKESLMRFLTNLPNVCEKHGTAYQCLIVKFSLYKKDFSSGMSASLIKLELDDIVTDESEISKLAGITKTFRQAYLGNIAKYMAVEAESEDTSGSEDDVPF